MSLTEFITLWDNYWTGDRIIMAMWIFGAAVQAMETPDENSGRIYSWLFRFTHILAANTNLVRKEQGRFRNVENDIRPQREVANVSRVRIGGKPTLHEESVM